MLHSEAISILKRFVSMTHTVIPTRITNKNKVTNVGLSVVSNESLKEDECKVALIKINKDWIMMYKVRIRRDEAYCELDHIYFLDENLVPDFIKNRFNYVSK